MKFIAALSALLVLASGCAVRHYTAYSGVQAWPVMKDSAPDTTHALPVYYRWPERPYRVVGHVSSDGHGLWRARDVDQAARLARDKGGEALIIRWADGTGSPARNETAVVALKHEEVNALVIRWKSQNEVDEESHRLDGARAYLRRSFPALRIETKPELWALGLEYVAASRLDINTQRGEAKLVELLSGLALSPESVGSTRWLFKVTRTHVGGLPLTEEWYGVATLNESGGALSVAFVSGGPDLVFSGRIVNGELMGELKITSGVHSLTQQLRGSMASTQIQLQSSNGDRAERMEVVLLR